MIKKKITMVILIFTLLVTLIPKVKTLANQGISYAWVGENTVIYSLHNVIQRVITESENLNVVQAGKYYYLEGHHEIKQVELDDNTLRDVTFVENVEKLVFDNSNHYEHQLIINQNDYVELVTPVSIISNGKINYTLKYKYNNDLIEKTVEYNGLSSELQRSDFEIKIGELYPHTLTLEGNISEEKQFSVKLNPMLKLKIAQFEVDGQVINENETIPVSLSGKSGTINIVAYKHENGQEFKVQIPFTYNRKLPQGQLQIQEDNLTATITKNKELLYDKELKYETEIEGKTVEIATLNENQLANPVNLKYKFNELFEKRTKSDVENTYPIRLVTELDGIETEIASQNYNYISKLEIIGRTYTNTNKPLIEGDNKAYIILKDVPKHKRVDVVVGGVLLDESITREYSSAEDKFSINKDKDAFTQNILLTVPVDYIKENIYSEKTLYSLDVKVQIEDEGSYIYNLDLNPILVDFREINLEEKLKNSKDGLNNIYAISLLIDDRDTLNFEIKASEEIEKIEYITVNGIKLDESKFNQNTSETLSTISVSLRNLNVQDENIISFGYKIILASGKVKTVEEKTVFNNESRLVTFIDRQLESSSPIIKQDRGAYIYKVNLNKQKEVIYSKSNKNITIKSSLQKGYMGIPTIIKNGLPIDGRLYLNPQKSSININEYLNDTFHTNWSYDFLLNEDASGDYVLVYNFLKFSDSFPFKIQIDNEPPNVILNEDNLINKKDNCYYVNSENENQDVILTIEDNFELDLEISSITVNGTLITKYTKGIPFNINLVKDGEYEISIVAYDKAGNKTVKKYVIVKDTKPANGKIVYQNEKSQDEDKTYFNTRDVTFKIVENEPFNTEVLKEIHYVVKNNEDVVVEEDTLIYPSDLTVNLVNYREGTYKIIADLIDLASNHQQISSVFVVDMTKPQLVNAEDVKINVAGRKEFAKVGDTLQFNFITNEFSKVIFEIEGKTYEKITENNTVSFAHTLIQDEINSNIDYTVTLIDNAKNSNLFTHKTLTIKDVTKPEIRLEVSKEGQANNLFVRSGDILNIKLYQNKFVESTENTDRVRVEVLNSRDVIYLDKDNNYEARYKVGDLVEGKIHLSVTLMDYAGNNAIANNEHITFDKTSPTGRIEIEGERSNQMYNHDVTLRLIVNELNTSTKVADFEIFHNGISIIKKEFPNLSINDIITENLGTEGKYRVVVRATDAAQNSFEIYKEFEVDKIRPNILGLYNGANIVNGKYYNVVDTPQFKLDQANDRIVSITLNGNDVTNQLTASMSEMTYKYVVVAIDDAQNLSEYSVEYTVDTSFPKLIINYLLTGAFYKEKPVPTVYYNDVNLLNETFSATLDGKHYVFGTEIPNGNHTLIAKVSDKADNTTVVEINFGVSKDGLSIVIPNVINEKFLQGKVNIKLSDFIQSSIDYDIINATINGESFNNDMEITKNGKYVIYFEVKDKAGNIEKKTIEFILDNTKPNIIFDNVKDKENFDDDRKIKVYLENSQDEITKIILNGEEVYDFERLSKSEVLIKIKENKEYKLEVFAVDRAGNESSIIIEFVKFDGFCWFCLIIIAIVVVSIILTGYMLVKRRNV